MCADVGADFPDIPAQIFRVAISFAADTGVDDNCATPTPECYNCSAAPICVPLPNHVNYSLGPYTCADVDEKKPYCNNGVCSNLPGDRCPPEDQDTFTCTGGGLFPDPNDCQKFHICGNGTVVSYTCSSNYVYSHAKEGCARRNVTTDCAVMKCRNTTVLEYVVYPKDANVYGICVRGEPTLFKCSDEDEFDTKTLKCKFVCKQEGLFPAPNKAKYYECIYVAKNKYDLVEWDCPAGTHFSPTREACIIN